MRGREFKIEVTIPENVLNTNDPEDVYIHIKDEIASLLPAGDPDDLDEIDVQGRWHPTNQP